MFKDYFHSKKAVLFDLDGTIINSHPIWHEACAEVASNLGFTWRGVNFLVEPSLERIWKTYLDYVGEDYGVPIPTLVSQTKDKFLTRILRSPFDRYLKEGFWPLINELKSEKEMRIGLVTNSDRDVAEKVLNHLHIASVFETVICGDEVKNRKPDPEIYEKSLKTLGLKAKEVLCFEDSPAGVKSAKKAGLQVIGLRNPLYSEKEFPSDLLFVEDFTVFPGNLDKTRKEVLEEEIKNLPPLGDSK